MTTGTEPATSLISSIKARGITLVLRDGELVPVGGRWEDLDNLTLDMVRKHSDEIARRLAVRDPGE